MRSLVALVCSHSRPEFVKTLRDTWIPGFSVKDCDLLLFFGRGAQREAISDEVFLDCDDSYAGLPEKVREIFRWARKNQYDRVLKCDDDVVINPKRFSEVLFTAGDFVGPRASYIGKPGQQILVPYGFCYWVSSKAMDIMVNESLPSDSNDEWWVASRLNGHGVKLMHDGRYVIYRQLPSAAPVPDGRPIRALRRVKMDNIFSTETVAWCIHMWVCHPSVEERCSVFKSVFANNVGEIKPNQ